MECLILKPILIWNRKTEHTKSNVRPGLVVGMDIAGLDVNILVTESVMVNGVTLVGLVHQKIHTQNVKQSWIVQIAGRALEIVIRFIICESVFFPFVTFEFKFYTETKFIE